MWTFVRKHLKILFDVDWFCGLIGLHYIMFWDFVGLKSCS